MKAVILAGGFGTRLRPLTTNIPKPMAPVMNTPMLEHIINLLKKYGMTDITMMLYFQPEVITSHFRDGSDFGVKINYVTSEQDLGTAGCITLAKEKLKDDSFLIISGDVFTSFNLGDAIESHKNNKAIATIVLTKSTDPLRYGIVVTEKTAGLQNCLKNRPGERFSPTPLTRASTYLNRKYLKAFLKTRIMILQNSFFRTFWPRKKHCTDLPATATGRISAPLRNTGRCMKTY